MDDFKVIINRAPLQFQECGISYYTSSLIKALEQSELKEKLVYHDLGFSNKTAAQFGRMLLNKLSGDKFYIKLKSVLYKRALDKTLLHFSGEKALYHETNNVPAIDLRVPYVTTIHDTTVFKFPSDHPSYRVKFFEKNFNRALNSNIIVVPSNSTKQDLIDVFGTPAEKIKVVAHGRNEFYRPINLLEAQRIAKKYVDKPFILFSGIIEPRKNISNLLIAFGEICKRKDVALVLAGDFGWRYKPIVNLRCRLGLKDVYFTGYISAEDLRGLYNSAELFVYPSLYEGFGFPPLEAMACGLPVVLSNVSSLPEVGGEAAIYIDPHAAESIVAGTLRVLEDDRLRRLMSRCGVERSAQFSWDKTAMKMIEIYRESISRVLPRE